MADRGAGMGGAEELEEEVGGAVDDCGLLDEVAGAVAHAEEAQAALHAVEVAGVLLDGGEHRQGDSAGGGVAFLDADVDAELAGLANAWKLREGEAVAG